MHCIRRSPVGVCETDEDLILPPALDQEIVSGITLDGEAKTTEHASTPIVGWQICRLYTVQSKLIKRVSDDGDESLADQTLALAICRKRVSQVAIVRRPAHDVVEADLAHDCRNLTRVEKKELDRPTLSEIIVVPCHLTDPERISQEIGRQEG